MLWLVLNSMGDLVFGMTQAVVCAEIMCVLTICAFRLCSVRGYPMTA